MHTILPALGVTGGGAAVGFGGVVILLWVVGIVLSIFWIWMLIDCLMSAMPAMEKLIWFLVIFFLHILGALLYFFIGRGRGSRTGTV